MEAFLLTLTPGTTHAELRRRLAEEAEGRVLLVLDQGRVVIAEFDRRLRDTIARWPGIARVGGITFAARPIRRIRVDADGHPLPAARPQRTTP